MSKIDLAQIVKILNLTQSDNDAEALSAIRIANARLKQFDLSWQDLIKAVPTEKTKRTYRYKPMPSTFDFGWFKAAVETVEFTGTLSAGHVEWLNSVVRFVNAHRFLPEKHWTDFVELWDNFRESRG